MDKRREFTRKDKAAMVRRATVNGEIRCEGCGLNLTGKRIEFDHTIAENLIIDKTRKLTAEDGRLLGAKCCHAPKTKIDTKVAAKTKRVGAKHCGIARKTKNPIQSAPFPKSEKASKSIQKSMPARRNLYEERT